MYFPAGNTDALDIVREYTGGLVNRIQVESALDFFIMIEPDFDQAVDETKFVQEKIQARQIIRQYAVQHLPCSLDVLQDLFYSFSNSNKYLYNIETISVVRTMLSTCWEGLAGWRD
jgi:hypothetical protein